MKTILTAETLVLQEAVDLSVMIKYILSEILQIQLNNQTLPIKCITDSKSLHWAVYSSKEVTEKRLKIELSTISGSLEKGEIESVLWVNSKHQLADCPTKKQAPHENLFEGLNWKT